MTFVAGNNKVTTSTTPNITVPALAAVGDILVIHFDQNNTDATTGVPTGLTLRASDNTVASYASKLYTATVDGTTIAPSGTITWPTLSASRAYSLTLVVIRNVSLTGLAVNVAHAATSPAVMPALTTTGTNNLFEIAAGKSNGTAITSWTPPAGWTIQQTAASASTFGGSAVIALPTGDGTSAAGTYGSETYTPNTASGAYVTYLLALPSVAVTNATVTVPVATMTLTALAPVVSGSYVASGSGPAQLTMTALVPAVAGSAIVTPPLATLSMSALVPGVTTSNIISATITVPAAVMTMSAIAPLVGLSITITSTSATLSLNTLPPAVTFTPDPLVYYLYTPPLWDNIQVMEGLLRYKIPTSTTTYRLGGQWFNIQSPGEGMTEGADYVFRTPGLVTSQLRDEMVSAGVPGTFS